MDPLWLAVILVGANILGITIAAVAAAVVLTRVSRQAGPRLQEVRDELEAAQEELHRLSTLVLSSQERLHRMTSGMKRSAGVPARGAAHATAVPNQNAVPRDMKPRKDARR